MKAKRLGKILILSMLFPTLSQAADLLGTLQGGGIGGGTLGGVTGGTGSAGGNGGNTGNNPNPAGGSGNAGSNPNPVGGGGNASGTALSELEPNDDQRSATALQPGSPYTGRFSSSSDEDWFHFQAVNPGAVATVEIPGSQDLQLSLQNAEGEVLAEFAASNDEDQRFVVVLPRVGDYYAVAKGGGQYAFTVSGDGIALPSVQLFDQFLASAIMEIEPDDTQDTAVKLAPGNPMAGVFESESDQDWFVFKSLLGETVTLQIPHADLKWRLSLLEEDGRTVAAWQGDTAVDQVFNLQLAAGAIYFLKAEPLDATAVGQSYVFKAEGDIEVATTSHYETLRGKAMAEAEPNDHILGANPISAGVPVMGQLQTAKDQDWYHLRSTEPNTLLTLEVPVPPADGVFSTGQWHFNLLDAAGNALAQWDSFVNLDLKASALLEKAGDYYITVTDMEDTRTPYLFQVSGENLVNPDDRNPDTNLNDVEVEPNDTPPNAYPIVSSVTMAGHLRFGDRDVFQLESDGNEILLFEMCPEGFSCAGGDSWVLYVFDGQRLAQLADTVGVSLGEIFDVTGSCEDTDGNTQDARHIYFLADRGFFGDALVGQMDPTYGSNNRLEVGIKTPGTYYVVVSPRLARTGGKGKIQCPLEIESFSDDQYYFNMVRTGLVPSVADLTGTAKAPSMRAQVRENTLHVPVVEVGDRLYSADLRLFSRDGRTLFELISSRSLGQVTGKPQDIKGYAQRATLVGNVVHIPMVEVNGRYYSGDLRRFEENGRTLFELIEATPLN